MSKRTGPTDGATARGVTRRAFLEGALVGVPLAGAYVSAGAAQTAGTRRAETILVNGRVATLDARRPPASAVAVADGRFLAVGSDAGVMAYRGPETAVIDAGGRTVIPGLVDSHTHVIRAGLDYNLELRWDGVPSLADALRMLREQARRTPPPQWVRVVGGWAEFQFAERRGPTLEELNEAAPDTPVLVLQFYSRAFLNRAALRAVGITRETPNPPGGYIQRDTRGNPTGLLVAEASPAILYSTLGKAPRLAYDDQLNSTRQFMRELNRLGVTSVIDAGGGGQNYPGDYRVIDDLARQRLLTLRIAAYLFAQRPGRELDDFTAWVGTTRLDAGDDAYRVIGAGEMLVSSAYDATNFLQPRPELRPSMEAELAAVVKLLAQNRWPFRIHATYDESITRVLGVFEAVNREVPLERLRWTIDHAELISPRNIERVAALGGGIAVQHRMAYQGEHFIVRYGAGPAAQTPPVARMLEVGVPLGAGTDATRITSYNPWVGLSWLVTGRTVGGTPLYPEANRLDRAQALRLYTSGSAWFSGEEAKKGTIEVGKLADLAVLSADYFSVPDEQIARIESLLTVVGGKVVHAAGEFGRLAPPPPPISPSWSPVAAYGGYARPAADAPASPGPRSGVPAGHRHADARTGGRSRPWSPGCDCSAV